jgi:hypothetical protein
MNTPELSSAAIPDLIPASGVSLPVRGSGKPAPPADVIPGGSTPDAEIAIADTMQRVHAMFRVDPKTREVHVSVVDDAGRVVRLIPAESVSEMLAAMAAYPTRR